MLTPFEPESLSDICHNVHIGDGFSAAFDCVLPLGHTGPHESYGGSTWLDPHPTNGDPHDRLH